MDKQQTTELAWKVEELDRRLKASNDLVIFLLGTLSGERPNLSGAFIEQLTELKKDFESEIRPELTVLLDRAVEALGEKPFDLDSIDSRQE